MIRALSTINNLDLSFTLKGVSAHIIVKDGQLQVRIK